MISEDLKNLLERTGGRYIIVEDGKPAYVIMSFAEYQSGAPKVRAVQRLTEEELIAKINSDIALWKESRQETNEALKNEIEKLEKLEYIKP